MSRIEHLARAYWFDLLIALLAIMAMLEVVLGRGSSGAPTTTLWFCLPALAILVLPLFARRWFPFAGPAAFWLLAAAISFVDPLLIPYPESVFENRSKSRADPSELTDSLSHPTGDLDNLPDSVDIHLHTL